MGLVMFCSKLQPKVLVRVCLPACLPACLAFLPKVPHASPPFFFCFKPHQLIRELNLDYIVDNPWVVIPVSALKVTNVDQVT
jgi:hypothetical protein